MKTEDMILPVAVIGGIALIGYYLYKKVVSPVTGAVGAVGGLLDTKVPGTPIDFWGALFPAYGAYEWFTAARDIYGTVNGNGMAVSLHPRVTNKGGATYVRTLGYAERNPKGSTGSLATKQQPVRITTSSPVTYQPINKSLHGLYNPKTGFKYSGR